MPTPFLAILPSLVAGAGDTQKSKHKHVMTACFRGLETALGVVMSWILNFISGPLVISPQTLLSLPGPLFSYLQSKKKRSLYLLNSHKPCKVIGINAKYNTHYCFPISTINVPKQWQETTCLRKQNLEKKYP